MRRFTIGAGGYGKNALGFLLEKESIEIKDALILERFCMGRRKVRNVPECLESERMPERYFRRAVAQRVRGYESVLFVGGVGGRTASRNFEIVLDVCKNLKIPIEAFLVIPFSFEGERRKRYAREAVAKAKRYRQCRFFLYENDRLLSAVRENRHVSRALGEAVELLQERLIHSGDEFTSAEEGSIR